MTTATFYVIDLPHTHYRPLALAVEPPSLAWLALALALAIAALALAALVITTGLLPITAGLNLALPPCSVSLAMAAAMFYLEVTWSASR